MMLPRINIQNPQVQQTRGRPPGSTNRQQGTSTSRDPSGFEITSSEINRAQRHCRECGEHGHDRRNCPLMHVHEVQDEILDADEASNHP